MKTKTHLLVVRAKTIVELMDVSLRSARTLLSRIRKFYNKQKHQYVSLEEFCQYIGISKEEVMRRLENGTRY